MAVDYQLDFVLDFPVFNFLVIALDGCALTLLIGGLLHSSREVGFLNSFLLADEARGNKRDDNEWQRYCENYNSFLHRILLVESDKLGHLDLKDLKNGTPYSLDHGSY